MDFLTLRRDADRARTASDVVIAGEWAFISNVLPIDLDNDRTPLPEYIEEQTLTVLANLEKLLAPIGATKSDVVSVRVSLANFDKMAARFERVYEGFFTSGRLPARSCIGVTHLTRGAQVAMDFVVRLGGA